MAPDLASLRTRVDAVRHEVIGVRLADLPPDRLEAFRAHLGRQAEEIEAHLQELADRAGRALADGDEATWRRTRHRAGEEVRHFDEAMELLRQVTDAHHQRTLTDRMTAQLGSPERLRLYKGTMIGLILLVVGLLVTELFVPLDPRTLHTFDVIDVSVCGVFIADFVWRLRLAPSAAWFWRTHWLDLATSIPIPTSPMRAGRVVRLVRLLRMARLLRAFRVLLFFWRGLDPLLTTMNLQLLQRSFVGLVAVLVLGALGIWVVEGGSPGALQNLGETLWWSFTTVVTGGFADLRNPTTWAGRGLTALLVIGGIVVVGVFTASLTSVLVREEETTAAVLALDERLTDALDQLREKLE